MTTLTIAKRELRQKTKGMLSSLSHDEISKQTSLVVQNLQSFPEYQRAHRISIFLSMPEGEISTAALVRDSLRSGKKVFVPYTHKLSSRTESQPTSIMDMVELHSEDDYERLQPDKWGIPTPSKDTISSRENAFGGHGLSKDEGDDLQDGTLGGLDLIVMPGMAFDRGFGRLGHGKGFYDYFLTRISRSSQQKSRSQMPFLVGIALKEQLLPVDGFVPMDTTDWKLDALVVGDGSILRSHP